MYEIIHCIMIIYIMFLHQVFTKHIPLFKINILGDWNMRFNTLYNSKNKTSYPCLVSTQFCFWISAMVWMCRKSAYKLIIVSLWFSLQQKKEWIPQETTILKQDLSESKSEKYI